MKRYLLRISLFSLFVVLCGVGGAARSYADTLYQQERVGSNFTSSAETGNSIVFDASNTPYIAFSDSSQSNGATVVKYNGSSWVNVGSAGFSGGGASGPNIKINPTDNAPYVVYGDQATSTAATVMKFNGTSWALVGARGFTPGRADFTTMAFTSDGTPYVAFSDEATSSAMSVMKYNGSSWVFVGAEGFSSSSVNYSDIAVASDDTPYVAFSDTAASGKVTVMKYNGSSWVNVGSAGFTAGSSNDIGIAFDSNDTPYVVYRDGGNGNKASVMKYNGSSWVNVGSAGFSGGVVTSTSIAISSSDTPYVAFKDENANFSSTIESFNGTSWTLLTSSADTDTNYVDLALDANDIPYVAYRDISDLGAVMRYAPLPSYTLSFDSQGGSSVSSQSVQQTATTTLPAGPTLSGSAFQGWNTASDGSGTTYAAGAEFVMPLHDVTLYAQWEAIAAPTHTSSSRRSGGSVSSQVANLTAMGNTAAADALKAQWPQLFGASAAANAASPAAVRDLQAGMTGDDVLALQKLLNANGFILAASGPGSPGSETTMFGALTRGALAAYQKAHGITPAAGYFGPLTRAQMKAAGFTGLWW